MKGWFTMDFFSIIAEDKIRKAIKDGDFANLPGQGKPLKLEDLSNIPEELRMAYKVMKNSNVIDDYDALRAELMTINDLINACENNDERQLLKRQKNEKEIRFEALMKKRRTLNSPASSFYKEQMLERLKGHGRKK
jgi:hypothetical protein